MVIVVAYSGAHCMYLWLTVAFSLLGRPKGNLKMGLVGLPNVGKSTTFNLLSKQSVPAENFPFCTIDPHEARMNGWLYRQLRVVACRGP